MFPVLGVFVLERCRQISPHASSHPRTERRLFICLTIHDLLMLPSYVILPERCLTSAGKPCSMEPVVVVTCLSMALQSFLLGFGCSFSFLILYTVGRSPLMGDQQVTRPLPAHRTAQTRHKRIQTSMPQVGLEPTFAAFERADSSCLRPRGHCDWWKYCNVNAYSVAR
jgi:hypothetical protein